MTGSKRTWTDEALAAAVATNITISGTLRTLGLSVSPGNFGTLAKHITRLGIDTAHFKGRAHGTTPSEKIPLDQMLKAGTYFSSGTVKRRLLKERLLRCECYECQMPPVWRDKLLVLQLDHINGDPCDNRLENLRLLCPNCHSQTRTFTGKKMGRGRYKQTPHPCATCGATILGRASDKCASCANPMKGVTKIDWPPAEALVASVLDTSYEGVGRALGVKGNAVRRHIKKKLGYAPSTWLQTP